MKPVRSALIVDAILLVAFSLAIFISYKEVQADKELVYNEYLAAMADNYDEVLANRDSKKYGLVDYEYSIKRVSKNDPSLSGVYIYGNYAVQIELRCTSNKNLDSTAKSLLAYSVESCIPRTSITDSGFKTSTGKYVTTAQCCKGFSGDNMVYTYVNGELIHKPDKVIPEGTMFSYQITQIICTIVFVLLLIAIPAITVSKTRQIKVKAIETATIVQNQRKEKLESFYSECMKNNIHSCMSAKETQKATLIAQKLGLTFSDISALFAESKSHHERKEFQKNYQALVKERKAEEKKLKLLTQYAGYAGREKRIAMLTAERDEHKRSADALSAGAFALMQGSQFKEKESNWGTVGGIASAIGGPGAGVAAALEEQARTERENAQIRAQNKKNKEYFAPVVNTSMNGAADHRSAANRLDKIIDETKTKLVADDSAAECFKRIKFKNTKVAVAKTGTCTVTTTASVKPFMIYDDVPAVVDGTVIADIYENDNLIGTAEMVLPVYGAGENIPLIGMALSCGHVDGKYTVKFRYKNLWAMEK